MRQPRPSRRIRRKLCAAALARTYVDNWTLDVERKTYANSVKGNSKSCPTRPNPRKWAAAMKALKRV